MVNAAKPRLRWRKDKQEHQWYAQTYSLTDGERPWFAKVQAIDGGWFWYGMGRNTSGAPIPCLKEAKKQAEAHVQGCLKSRT